VGSPHYILDGFQRKEKKYVFVANRTPVSPASSYVTNRPTLIALTSLFVETQIQAKFMHCVLIQFMYLV
jgi:hypothetical protein